MNLQEILAKLCAWITGKETELAKANETVLKLTSDKDALQKQLDAATGKTGEVEKQLAAANTQIGTLQTEATTKDSEIKTLKDSQKTVEELSAKKAAEMLAGQAVPTNKLPATVVTTSTEDQQVAALRAKLGTETDPKEKFKISDQISQLLAKKE